MRTGHGNMYITINFDEADKPFEVFGTLGKAGGCDSAQLEAISRLVSLALRSGVDTQLVVDQLRGITCCPAWDNGVLVRSGPDALSLSLERQLIKSGHSKETSDSDAVQLKFMAEPVLLPVRAGRRDTEMVPTKCPDCNGQVYFAEGCMQCTDVFCGWSKCD